MIQLTLVIGAVGCFLLGSLILIRNPKVFINLLASGIVYSLAFWLLTILMFINAESESIAMLVAKLYYGTAASFVAMLSMFVNKISDNDRRKNQFYLIILTLLFGIVGSLILVPGFIVDDVVISSAGNYIVASGLSYALYAVYFVGSLIISAGVVIRKLLKSTKKMRMQLGLFLIGLLSLAAPGIVTDVMIPYSQNDYLVWICMIIMLSAGLLAIYVVAKKRMFDVRFAAVRTLAYILSLAFMIVIYYSIATTLSRLFFFDSSVDQSILGIVLALGLLIIFQPMKKFFDHLTNKIFYRDNYASDEFFARVSKILTSTTDLRNLLERVSIEISSTLKSSQAFFCVINGDGRYMSAGTNNHNKMPKEDIMLLVNSKVDKQRFFVASLLKKDSDLRRMMSSHRIEIALPFKQGDVSGCLCLGGRLDSHYCSRDFRVLETMADELIIAIQNTISIQEIKDINENLQQKIANATRELRGSNATLRELDKAKDEFVSMASHQLRTPLTSVKGYISMVLEGDAGEITPTQKQFLEEAYVSSERMVNLINDFLNVSRLQTGKFIIEKRPINLAKVVEQEIDSLKPSAASRNLKFKYKKPSDFPLVNVDESKLRQVIMNFADNAIYYSHEGTAIIISLYIEKKSIVFTVKDTGIGVPESEQDQLFGKFFRATNARQARPDGTGVGLFLAKKVIDAHNGQIIFKSAEGKGSVFGFRLPLDDL